ncbi:hypothetical protein [Rhizobium leguminosarum]|uniref:hypothetical protein n=1 Tax=Rhizobium leguminosarum TaxID=384 RepID=UPI001FE21F8F|nr:hypothetical protein [Rhizobium leguminosarum]
MYVADEDLLEIFGVTQIEEAQRRFIKLLPAGSNLRDFLSGALPPTRAKVPSYLRLLMFLCWMQTTETRGDGNRQFHEIFESHMGFRPWSMSGLNGLWEHFRDFLKSEHGVTLVLPDIHPVYTQIGRTLQLAFPTWRDKEALRKLKRLVAGSLLLDPLTVSNTVRTSRGALGETMQSFVYNFNEFDQARKRGFREFEETPFWRAWYAVVAEQAAVEQIEVVESDYGGYELFRVPPVGERVQIATPEEAVKLVPRPLAKLITSGRIDLESLGSGRFRAQAKTTSNIVLIQASQLARYDRSNIRSSAAVNSNWVVAVFRGNAGDETAPVPTGVREFGWHDGIRVGGGAYLGRSPLTPTISGPVPEAIEVAVAGKPVGLVRMGQDMALLPGVYAGIAIARNLRASHEVLMVARANEISEVRRLAFDLARDIPEDEFHYGNGPSSPVETEMWSGTRTPPCDELVTIGEGLYQRSARGLPLADAVEIVRRGLSLTDDHPSEWDILRSFADAGWLEPTFLRHFPARRLLQRSLTAKLVGAAGAVICGPTPLAVIDRLMVAARAAGGVIETWNGVSAWTLPRYVFRAPSDHVRREFLRRAELGEAPGYGKAVADVADHGDVHGFRVVGRLLADRGFFGTCFNEKMTEGLYRLERPGSFSLFHYRSVVPGKKDQNYVSPSVALLSHHLRLGGDMLEFTDGTLFARAARVTLPSSWARWASDVGVCNAGPSKRSGSWRYEYPVGAEVVEAVSKLLPVKCQKAASSGWREKFVMSASNRERKIYDSRMRRVLACAGMHGKS